MKHQLRQLFILSVICSVGLLCLQAYWIRAGWKSGKEILTRQVNYAFQRAVAEEWKQRKDTLVAYLKEFLSDTGYIAIGTKYNEKEKLWMATFYDPQNPADYSSFSSEQIPLGEKLLPGQKEKIIEWFILSNIRQHVSNDIIFYYTQRFGKSWSKKYAEMKLDTALVNRLLLDELARNNISTPFSVRYRDTTVQKDPARAGISAVYSDEIEVNYSALSDREKKYKAFAIVQSPGYLLFRRMWLTILSSVMLLALTLFCLYRMYRTIMRQKQLDVLKNDFISNMTHELKTPIATVSAAIDGLQYYDGLEDRQRTERYLNTSRAELKKLDEMLSNILSLSLSENLDDDGKKERFLLKEFLEKVFSSFAVQPSFYWELVVDPLQKIYGNKEKLASVFQNIIENAIKYGKGEVRVKVEATQAADQAVIIISDNGPGIEPVHLPNIFDKFYRVPGSSVAVKGFGLGLYYTARIISAHGGTITAQSDKGLSFTIQLPLKN